MMGDIEEYFDSIRDEYSEAIKKINPCYHEMISSTLGYLPNNWIPKNILELGCGTGNLTILLREKFPETNITGVDISEESLEICKKRINSNNVHLQRNDLKTICLENEHFDIVISSLTVHHLNREDRKNLYGKVKNWIKRKGWLIICDRYNDDNETVSDINRGIWHERAIANGATPEEWNTWMKHEIDHDHPGKLIDQVNILKEDLFFTTVDIVWRKLLWAVIYAQK
jgi:tRNA (cmo5U34)-methyltransferase